MKTMLPILTTALELVVQIAAQAAQWLDGTSLPALAILALVVYMVANRLPPSPAPAAPPIVSGVILLGYFLHRYSSDADQVDCLLAALLRALLASSIGWNASRMILLVLYWLAFRLGRLCLFFRYTLTGRGVRACQALQRRCLRRRPPPVAAPKAAPPPLPRAYRLRQLADAARADYDAEVAALTGLPLDEDERDTLLELAKQRLLQRLKQTE